MSEAVSGTIFKVSLKRMLNKQLKKSVSLFFIFVFFMKMLITAVPVFFSLVNDESVNSVIMQLEIEENDKSDDKIKESDFKKLYTGFCSFNFEHPFHYLDNDYPTAESERHIQSFYPPVPTPPPNS